MRQKNTLLKGIIDKLRHMQLSIQVLSGVEDHETADIH